MWSFAILLWELASREIPFPDLSPMEAGMKVRLFTRDGVYLDNWANL